MSTTRIDTYIDLFCGIGGFRVGLGRHGLKCVFSSDINKHAREAYKANYDEYPSGDITKIEVEDIPEHDMITGGFPCQAFSISGKKKGLSDSRGQLFYEIIRIAEHHRPKVVFLENVRNILEIQGGDVFELFVQEWESIGYRVTYHLLNASLFGVPQARWRVYFVIIRNDVPLKSLTPDPSQEEPVYLCDIIDPAANDDLSLRIKEGIEGNERNTIHEAAIVIRETCSLNTLSALFDSVGVGVESQLARIYSIHGHAPTQTTSGSNGYVLVDEIVREMNLLEMKRVMGFPDDHHVSKGSHGISQLGNAVIPRMIELVYGTIVRDDGRSDWESFSTIRRPIASAGTLNNVVRRCSEPLTPKTSPDPRLQSGEIK